LVLNDQHYQPSLQVALITQILADHRADLLVIESLDSYLPPDASTNDSQSVRPYLEALQAIAGQSGCAVVGTRHPGKDPANLCPGSHEWEDVPRISVVLERSEDATPRYWMLSHRCGVGLQPAPQQYRLLRTGVHPPVFAPLEKTDETGLAMAQAAPDPADRDRLQTAVALLTRLLGDEWVESRVIFAHGDAERLGEGTIRRAARILHVQKVRQGKGLAHLSHWGKEGLKLLPGMSRQE